MFYTREECGKVEPSSNLRMKVMPNFNALWAIVWLSVALQKPKKKTPQKITCLEKNDKCQQMFIDLHLFLVFYIQNTLGILIYYFFFNHCGFASLCSRPDQFAAETSVVNVAGSHLTSSGVPKTMCHPCMMYSRCHSEVFHPWHTPESCLILYWAVELHCFFSNYYLFFSHQNCSCREIQTQDPVSLRCSAMWNFTAVPVGASMFIWFWCVECYSLMYVDIFLLIGLKKKAHAFQDLELILFEKIGEV